MEHLRKQPEGTTLMKRKLQPLWARPTWHRAVRAASWAGAMVCIRQISISYEVDWLWLTYAWLNFPSILGEVPLRLIAGVPLSMIFPSDWSATANLIFDGAVAFVLAVCQWLIIETIAYLWLTRRRAQAQ